MNFNGKRTFLLLWFALVISINLNARLPMIGLPEIRNFPRLEYAGGLQNWSCTETENGLLYFANNSGLLEYDGVHWSLYKSVQAVNRAVCADNNRIYTGAFNEFGFYEENERGVLIYHSLVYLIQD